MIVVTAAGGSTGAAVVRALWSRGERVRALVGSSAPRPELTALVHAGFAHRRKALAGSLALVPGAPDDLRDQTRRALTEIGYPADARAERIGPDDWPRLADAIGRERLTSLRPR